MTGQVWAMWHGGSSYAVPYVADDVETFESIADVVDMCESRYANRDGTTPLVDETSEAHVWLSDPRESRDPYPDWLVRMGPDGFETQPA